MHVRFVQEAVTIRFFIGAHVAAFGHIFDNAAMSTLQSRL
jgi:hypothetical protein